MRWSKLILSLGILSAVSLVACRKENSTDAAIVSKNKLEFDKNQNPNMQPRSTTEPRPDDGNKVVINSPTQCYADLCQANHELSLADLMSDAEKGSPEQREYYEKYINPLVIKTMNQRAVGQKAAANIIQKYQDEFENLKLTEIQRRLFTALAYIAKSDLVNAKDIARIDKALSALPHSKAIADTFMKGGSAYLTAMYPGMNEQEAAEKEARYIQESGKKFQKATELEINGTDSLAIVRALKGKTLSRNDLDTIASEGATNRKIESLLLGELHEKMDKLGLTEADFYRAFKKATQERQLIQIQDYNPTESARCEVLFYQSMNLAPKKDDLEKFEVLKEHVRKASLSLLSQSDPAYAIVEKANFYLPNNPEENVNLWHDGFKEAVKSVSERALETANYGPTEAFLTAFGYSLRKDPKVNGLCDDMYDPTIIDAITPQDGASRLSWLTVRYPMYGISVLAHEIGHVIAKNSKQFSGQMTCISEQNRTDKYTAEDFADMVAVKTERNLEADGIDLTGKKANVGCLFAGLNPAESLINKNQSDAHSSNLFRAVKFALYRKQEIPASCKAMAQQESPNVLNSCDQ
jgi:hypothetical protein